MSTGHEVLPYVVLCIASYDIWYRVWYKSNYVDNNIAWCTLGMVVPHVQGETGYDREALPTCPKQRLTRCESYQKATTPRNLMIFNCGKLDLQLFSSRTLGTPCFQFWVELQKGLIGWLLLRLLQLHYDNSCISTRTILTYLLSDIQQHGRMKYGNISHGKIALPWCFFFLGLVYDPFSCM